MRILKKLTLILTVISSIPATILYAQAADTQRHTLLHNGTERTYLLRIPASVANSPARVPLVLVLHGGGGNADNAEKMTGFTDKAIKEGFIVAYPEGSGRRKNGLLTWNAGHCCGYAMHNRVDDTGFISTLIDTLIARYPIDPGRIYATGMSNGGMMTHRLGIELSGKLAAIAPVVATVFGDEKMPARPVSAIMLNGVLDKSVPHAGGAPGGRFSNNWDGTPARPALEQAAFWAGANACTSTPVKAEHAAYTRWQYSCPGNRSVELYLLNDNGHAWPGGQAGSRMGDRPTQTFDGTDVIWDFFKTHRQ